MRKDDKLLRRAFDAWLAASALRSRRERQKRFTYGDQWIDPMETPEGNIEDETHYLLSRGQRPLTNNLIRQLVKNIVGRYRTLAAEGAFYDTSEGSFDSRNRLAELDCRMLEEFIISGCAVQRTVAERRPEGDGVWVDNVSPEAFFVNDFRDPRAMDVDFIGMVHDMTPGELVNRFCRGSRQRAEALRHLYLDGVCAEFGTAADLGTATPAGTGFFIPRAGRCRAVEVWELRAVPSATPGGRHYVDMRWHCTWLAPDGTVLDSYDSPFGHRSHPFTLRFYPLTDGEVHSFVEDVIDQQKTINRLVVLIDTMLRSSAKGALLYPVGQLPPGLSLKEVAHLWSAPGAVIPVNGRLSMEMPRQVSGSGGDAGAYQLLNLQMKLFEDISGITDAMLGRNITGAAGATLYDAQARNGAIGLADLLETFAAFTSERSAKAAATEK